MPISINSGYGAGRSFTGVSGMGGGGDAQAALEALINKESEPRIPGYATPKSPLGGFLGGGGYQRPLIPSGAERGPTGMPGQNNSGRKKVFTKTVGGPGMVPGRIRLNAWEPDAAFAGYEDDLGAGPARANIDAPGPSAASLFNSPPTNQPPSGGYSGPPQSPAEADPGYRFRLAQMAAALSRANGR